MEQIVNIEDLKETCFRKGFPKEIVDTVQQALLSSAGDLVMREDGKIDCLATHDAEVKGAQIGYDLYFVADPAKGEVYLNGFDATVLDHPDGRLAHHFSSNTFITAAEAGRMMVYGTRAAVNKDLFKKVDPESGNKQRIKYNVWISVDTDNPDQNGMCPAKTYHEDYYKKRPFDLSQSLHNLHVPVKELQENSFKFGDYERDLKKANVIEVTISRNGKEETGYLCVNPQIGDIDVYDANRQLIPRPERKQAMREKQKSTQQQAPKASEDVKKKPQGQTQKMNRQQGSQPRKGLNRWG